MWEVMVARLEVWALRSWATWREAWARAARRSLTVLEKRESARAACLARASLRPLVAAARRLSARARLAASLRYTALNLLFEWTSALATERRRVFRVRAYRTRSRYWEERRAAWARFCSAAILLRMEVEVALSLAAVRLASRAIRAA